MTGDAGRGEARSGNGVHRCRHRRHCRGEDVNLRDRTGSGWLPIRVPARGGVNRAPPSRVALHPLIGASHQHPPSAHLTRHLDISPRRQHISIFVSTASSMGVLTPLLCFYTRGSDRILDFTLTRTEEVRR